MLKDIYILGSGIRGPQFTLETSQYLAKCKKAFVLHDDLMVLEQVRRHCGQVVDLLYLYEDRSQARRRVYEKIAEVLIETARNESPIAFVVHGNPLFLVSASEYILEQARTRGLTAQALPGVSSFDTILCDLELDLGYGVQLFDVTTMFQNGWRPNPSVPLLLFQLSTFNEPGIVSAAPNPAILRPLVEFLSRHYPREHQCTVVYSASHILERASQAKLRLGDLCNPAFESELRLVERPTLYVPALG